MRYLTVHDILWINIRASGRVNRHNSARLEEGAFYQYAYGDSQSVVSQAARFLPGFERMHGFESHNSSTAFVAGMAFLALNGRDVSLGDASGARWFADLTAKGADRVGLVESALVPELEDPVQTRDLDVRQAVEGVFARFPQTIAELSASQTKPQPG